MKRLLTLIMAGCMVLGSLGTAAAIDVKVKGQWDFSYGYYNHASMYSSEKSSGAYDRFQPVMRARTQVEFIASESLSALLHFEIGDMTYGNGKSGAGLDADQTVIEVKRAHLDWIIPGTAVKTRMGVQGVAFPMATGSNPFLSADAAGITVSTDFTPNIGMTAFWIRPFDSNTGEAGKNKYDEMDVFGLSIPIKNQYVKATPWGGIATIGKDSGYYGKTTDGKYADTTDPYLLAGPGGVGSGRGRAVPYADREDQAMAWWAGVALELPVIDPFYVKFDAIMGGMDAKSNYSSFGWMLATDAGYKWSWGKTGIMAWYASGDEGKEGKDDYGTIPAISTDGGWDMVAYGMSGRQSLNKYEFLSGTGLGTWGVGLNVADVSFVDKLTHKAQVVFMRGTNEGERISRDTPLYNGVGYDKSGKDKSGNSYMISTDSAWIVSLMNKYQFNKEFSMGLDMAYIHMNLSEQRAQRVRDTSDMFLTAVSFQYKF